MPRPVVALPWGSESMTRTLRSLAAKEAPKLIAVVVLPTPPFWLVIASTRLKRTSYHGCLMTERTQFDPVPRETSRIKFHVKLYFHVKQRESGCGFPAGELEAPTQSPDLEAVVRTP